MPPSHLNDPRAGAWVCSLGKRSEACPWSAAFLHPERMKRPHERPNTVGPAYPNKGMEPHHEWHEG
jgi:hypothetical protein